QVASESGEHFAQSFGPVIDRLPAVFACSDTLPCRDFPCAHPLDNHQRARLIARGEKSIGKGETQPGIAAAGAPHRLPRKRLRLGRSPEPEQDESTLLRLERRKQAARGNLVERGQGLLLIATIGGGPGSDQWRQKCEVPTVAGSG